MEQGRFARYLFLVVLVVAVVGLLNSGFLEATGFAAKDVRKSPACAAAEKAAVSMQKACKTAEGAAKTTPKNCEAAKKAYGLAQVNYARTPTPKTKGLMDTQKKAMDTACANVEKTKKDQETKCGDAARTADNKNVVCAPPAPAQPAAQAQQPAAPPAPAPEQQATPPQQEQQAAAQPQAAPAAGPECTDTDQNPDHVNRADITTHTINYTVAGTVHGVGGQGMAPLDYPDRCDSPTMLKEFYCSRGQGGTWATDMTYDCARDGKVCQNGACVASGTLDDIILAISSSCDGTFATNVSRLRNSQEVTLREDCSLGARPRMCVPTVGCVPCDVDVCRISFDVGYNATYMVKNFGSCTERDVARGGVYMPVNCV